MEGYKIILKCKSRKVFNRVKLSDSFLQEVKDKNDISDVISRYISLKKKGRNMVGLCPFHSEKTASFFVYPNNGSFYCFGCGAGGDVITFLRLIENFDYMEAIKYLAERSGMTIPQTGEDDTIHKKKMMIYEINREIAKFYHGCLFKNLGNKAMRYLISRKLGMSTIKHFGLGYAPKEGYSAVNYLRGKGYDDKSLILANVASVSRNGNIYDRFRDRIMFPIIDLRGNVIAFGGRIMDQGQPKYLNTSDTLVFKKSDNIFALNFAKKKISENFILAEGYMDVIALHQAGFENAVATLGTALTESQVRLISRYTNEVVISYDSDEAGRKASDRAIKMLRKNGILIKVLTIPKGKDPDEFIKTYGKEGTIRFKNLLESSSNDIEYKMDRIKTNYDINKNDDKIKYLNKCIEILCEVSNQIECEVYANKLSGEVGVEKKSIMLQIERLKKKKNKDKEIKIFKEIQKNMFKSDKYGGLNKNSNLKSLRAEEALLSCIINNQDVVNNISKKISSDFFMGDLNRKIYDRICELNFSGRNIDITTISSEGFSINEIGYITKLSCEYIPPPDIERDLNDYISVIKNEKQATKISDVSNVNEDEIKKYIEGLKRIKK